MTVGDCKHGRDAWDSWYHCGACENEHHEAAKVAEWNAAIEAAAEALQHRHDDDQWGPTASVREQREIVLALKREVKP